MAWLCVTKGGAEIKFKNKPQRAKFKRYDADVSLWYGEDCEYEYLPKGSIKNLIGRELTWNDEPVELK